MMDEKRQKLEEQYFDAALSLLLDDYAGAEGAELLRAFERADAAGAIPEMPEELDKKCRRIAGRKHPVRNMRVPLMRAVRRLGNAAACLLIAVGVCTVTVLSVDAFRSPVLNFFLHPESRYSTVDFEDRQNPTVLEESSIFVEFMENLPKGYEVTQKKNAPDGHGGITCTDENGAKITLKSEPAMGARILDTEEVGQKEIEIGGQRALLMEKNGYRLVWIDEDADVLYTLFADGLALDVFLEFAGFLAE